MLFLNLFYMLSNKVKCPYTKNVSQISCLRNQLIFETNYIFERSEINYTTTSYSQPVKPSIMDFVLKNFELMNKQSSAEYLQELNIDILIRS